MAKFFEFSKKQSAALLKILDLSDAGVQELANLLGAKLDTLHSPEDVLTAASKFKHIEEGLAFEILDKVLPLCFGVVSRGYPIEEVVTGVVRALQDARSEQPLSALELKRLKSRLLRLLSSDDLSLKAKAYRLMSDNANTFASSAILSDMRPIFSGSSAEKIEAGVVIHNLKINYLVSGDRQDFFVTLDSADLKQLQKDIARAIKKEKALATLITSAHLTHIKAE